MSDPRTTGDQPAVPFTLPEKKRSHLNGPRILEALLIAAVSAVASSQITTARLDERLAAMQRDQERLSAQVDRLRSDFYRPRWEGQAMRVPLTFEGVRQ